MENLSTFFFLMFAAALLVALAQKIQISYPIALILGGTLIGFIPGLHPIDFDPNLILVIVLPPILYASAYGISFREFKTNWKEIFSLALSLVFITTLVIGLIFKWVFPQFPWPLAFAFGAIIAPSDATAASAILKRFSLNSRLLTILEGESLVNDASALVLYRLAVTALLSGVFSFSSASFDFFKIVLGGIAVGFILGIIIQRFSRRYLGPVVGAVLSITIPYITYITADSLGVSGVLAVVVNGLVGSQTILSHPSPLRRVVGFLSWDMFSILLNCFIFVLIGLQLKLLVSKMDRSELLLNISYGVLFTFILITVRLAWVYIKGIIHCFKAQLDSKSTLDGSTIFREATVIGWSGMRGIVSLTAAMALPLTLYNGSELEGRDEVIFLTFVVILLTLMIPGLTLQSLVKLLKLDGVKDHKHEHLIRKELAKIAHEKITELSALHPLRPEETTFLTTYFNMQRQALEVASSPLEKLKELESLRLTVIQEQRNRLLEMWRQQKVSDTLLSELEHELDLQEIRLARAELT